MVFNSKLELKKWLKIDSPYDLVLVCKRKDLYYSTSIPYSCDKEYFDRNNLYKIIIANSKDNEFLEAIWQEYNTEKKLQKEMYSIKVYMSNPYASSSFNEVIYNLITKIGDGIAFVRFALFISKLANSGRDIVINHSFPSDLEAVYSEDDPRHFKQEEWLSKVDSTCYEQEDQMRLF